jgi:hypothetical protein
MADHNNMELVAMERVAMERVLALLRLENDEALQAPNGRVVNAPTADEFFDAYTPLMMNGSIEWDYVRNLTRFQIELVMNNYVRVRMARTNQVILLSERMARFNPSIIAFAALMRADDFVVRMALGIPDDDDYDDESWVNRGDHDGLIHDLGLDRSLVQEAAVALENAIPNRVVRSYINWMDGGFQDDHPIRHLMVDARVRPDSPLQVDMFP